jgi:hypothetical protein
MAGADVLEKRHEGQGIELQVPGRTLRGRGGIAVGRQIYARVD